MVIGVLSRQNPRSASCVEAVHPSANDHREKVQWFEGRMEACGPTGRQFARISPMLTYPFIVFVLISRRTLSQYDRVDLW